MNMFVSFTKGYARVNDVTVELSTNDTETESIYWNETAGFIKYKNEMKLLMNPGDFETYVIPWIRYVETVAKIKAA